MSTMVQMPRKARRTILEQATRPADNGRATEVVISPLVMKFGGTSLAKASQIRAAAEIVAERVSAEPEERHVIVVVSALGGITDALATACRCAAVGQEWRQGLADLKKRHKETVDALSLGRDSRALRARVSKIFAELKKALRGAELVGEATARTQDAILGAGERLSAPIFAAACRSLGLVARDADSRDLIATDSRFGEAKVLARLTREKVVTALGGVTSGVTVLPGYVATDEDGRPTTLGRGGSDYTAAIIGTALEVAEVEIWTDVDGVMSADPSKVCDARSLAEVSFEEVTELAHFGAKVVYEPTIHAAREAGATLVIRNTRNPAFVGTRLVAESALRSARPPVRGITSLPKVALIRVDGTAIRGSARARERLFRAVADTEASAPLLVQVGGGQGVSLALQCHRCETVVDSVRQEFELELAAGRVEYPELKEGLACVAVVGTALDTQPGIAGHLFGALSEAGVNVRAVAHGSSDRSVVFLVDARDENTAVRAVHAAFFPAPAIAPSEAKTTSPAVAVASTPAVGNGHPGRRSISSAVPTRRARASVYVAGVGGVGSELLRQMADLNGTGQSPVDEQSRDGCESDYPLKVAGVATSSTVILDPDSSLLREPLSAASGVLARTPGSDALIEAALSDRAEHRVFVDCTSDPDLPRSYPLLVAEGVGVVAANKTGFAANCAIWHDLEPVVRARRNIYFETTVGAGLPIVRTIGDLVATGDRIRRIEGVLSGTLSYVLAGVHGGRPLSEVVREAHSRGMTEPDPRADLMGGDVARKAIILSRVAGFEPYPGDVEPEALIPNVPDVSKGDQAAFWQVLPQFDASMAARVEAAGASGTKLAYLARVTPDGTTVGLREVAADHPAAVIAPGGNVACIWTERYADLPLTIQGPGAGPEVTAAGVLADILRAITEG